MGALDWSPVADKNATADPFIAAREGASARSFPASLQGVMAGVAALAADQGGGLVTTGEANAFEVATASGLSRLRAGLTFMVQFDRDNTGLATLNVDGTGPKPLCDADGIRLLPRQVKAGRYARVTYDAGAGTWRTDALSGIDGTSDAQKVSDTSSPIGGALKALADAAAQKADTTAIPTLPVAARVGMITAPYKRPIQDHFGDMCNLRDAVPDRSGGVNVIGYMHAVRGDSPFKPFFIPPGKYRCDAPLPVIAGPPLSMYGVGGNGDGPGDYDYANATLFVLNFAQGDAFTATTNFPCTFENFRIETDAPYRDGVAGIANTGAAISISGDTGNNAGSVIRQIGMAEKDIGVRMFKASLNEISMCHIVGWRTAGILNTTDASREGAGGFIHHNRMFGGTGTLAQQAARGPCLHTTTVYIWVFANNFSGGQYCVYFSARDRAAGAPRFFRNTFEDWWIAGFFAGTADGTSASMLEFEDNELSLVADRPNLLATIYIAEHTAPWLNGFSISRNRIRNNQFSRVGVPMIIARSGIGGKLNANTLTHMGLGAQAGISIIGATTNAALGGPIEAYDNQYFAEGGGSFATRMVGVDGLVKVRDPQGLNSAFLAAAYPNPLAAGSEVWVSDGEPGSNPLSGSREGTLARYIGGWRGGDEAPGAWTAYTPTVSSGTGAITTLGTRSGSFQKRGKTVDFRIDVTIAANGTGAGAVQIGLPLPAKGLVSFIGREAVAFGEAVQGITFNSGDSSIAVTRISNGGYAGGNGARIYMTGTYETT